MKTFDSKEAETELEKRGLESAWRFKSGQLECEFKFADFMTALGFMNKAAVFCEEMDHHPDWSNVYNRLQVKLSTHSAGGVTEKDFELAERMSALFSEY